MQVSGITFMIGVVNMVLNIGFVRNDDGAFFKNILIFIASYRKMQNK